MSDARAPSPSQIMRCIAAFRRVQQAFGADEDLAGDEAPITTALAGDPGALQPAELLNRLLSAATSAERAARDAAALAEAIHARGQRYEARAMVLRAEMLQILQELGWRSYTGSPLGTVSVRPGVPHVVVTDEAKIPQEYWHVRRALDRQELREDLLAGVVVEGAELSNPAPSLAIRRDKPAKEAA